MTMATGWKTRETYEIFQQYFEGKTPADFGWEDFKPKTLETLMKGHVTAPVDWEGLAEFFYDQNG
jgi:hypothetical protein